MAFEQFRLDIEANNGLCRCGCGRQAPIAKRSNQRLGHVKGRPVRFIPGHNHRKARDADYRIEDRGWRTPCHIWQGTTTDKGYGEFFYRGTRTRAHVRAWEAVYGPVPEGLELDHLCHVRCCVNPEHLEPVTHAENIRRSITTTPLDTQLAILKTPGSSRTVASQFGVSHTTVLSIRRRRSM